jgi:hypothetical protein
VLGDKRRAAAAAAIFFFHHRDFEKKNPWGYQKRVSQSSTTAQNPQTIEELLLRCELENNNNKQQELLC